MSLTIGSVSGVECIVGGHAVAYGALAPTRRTYGGVLGTSRSRVRGYARMWTLQTPPMVLAEAEALEAELLAPGSVLVSGDLVGSNVRCYATNVKRHVDRSLIWAAVSFELTERDAVNAILSDGVVFGDAAVGVET